MPKAHCSDREEVCIVVAALQVAFGVLPELLRPPMAEIYSAGHTDPS